PHCVVNLTRIARRPNGASPSATNFYRCITFEIPITCTFRRTKYDLVLWLSRDFGPAFALSAFEQVEYESTGRRMESLLESIRMEARFVRVLVALILPALMGAGYRTNNFVVTAPTPEVAKQVGDAAEVYRKQLA